MSIDQFTEDSYEQALIELFHGVGYQYQCGYTAMFRLLTDKRGGENC